MYSIPCILFAGGKSSRMGKDKALLPFGGFETLTEYQYRRLQKIFCKVYISTKDPSKFPFKADFLIDKYPLFAPTAAFLTIYEKLKSDRFFVLGVDMPFVNAKCIDRIITTDTTEVDATLAKTKNGIESLCGIYHRSLEDEFKAMLQQDRHKLRSLLSKSAINTFLCKEEYFLNLNKPYEYQKAKELYATIKRKKS